MNKKYELLNQDNIVSLEEESKFVVTQPTFKVDEFITALVETKLSDTTKKWNSKGVECEVLRPHKGWKKGKVRIKVLLEFCSDEPDDEMSTSQ